MSRTNQFEKKVNADGTPNEKYVDALKEDKAFPGQNFSCVSFMNPDKILAQRDHFMFEQFVKQWGMTNSMKTFSTFINFLSYKYSIDMGELTPLFEDFVKEEETKIKEISVKDQFQFFMDKNGTELGKRFDIKNKFKTSVRGVKVRGSFETLEQANLRAKVLREGDPNHNVYVGETGKWLMFDPGELSAGQTDYLEDELNQLAHEKDKNEAIAKAAFDKRVLETKKKAMQENEENSKKTGNKLTQKLDDDGNLVGIGNTQENALRNRSGGAVDVGDIQNELFGGDDVIITPGDHGKSVMDGKFITNKED